MQLPPPRSERPSCFLRMRRRLRECCRSAQSAASQYCTMRTTGQCVVRVFPARCPSTPLGTYTGTSRVRTMTPPERPNTLVQHPAKACAPHRLRGRLHPHLSKPGSPASCRNARLPTNQGVGIRGPDPGLLEDTTSWPPPSPDVWKPKAAFRCLRPAPSAGQPFFRTRHRRFWQRDRKQLFLESNRCAVPLSPATARSSKILHHIAWPQSRVALQLRNPLRHLRRPMALNIPQSGLAITCKRASHRSAWPPVDTAPMPIARLTKATAEIKAGNSAPVLVVHCGGTQDASARRTQARSSSLV